MITKQITYNLQLSEEELHDFLNDTTLYIPKLVAIIFDGLHE